MTWIRGTVFNERMIGRESVVFDTKLGADRSFI